MAKPTPKPTDGMRMYEDIDKHDWLYDLFFMLWLGYWCIVFPILVMLLKD